MELEQAQQRLNKATDTKELIAIAITLQNRPEHVAVDKVTYLAMTSFEQGKRHVQHMIEVSNG